MQPTQTGRDEREILLKAGSGSVLPAGVYFVKQITLQKHAVICGANCSDPILGR
jgi:hypothetical protein